MMTTTPWKNMMRRIYNHRLRQEAHSLWGCLAFGFDIQLFIVFVKLDCHYLYTIYIYIYDERTLRSHFDDRNNMRKTPYQNIVYNIYYIRDWINIVRGCENVSQFSFKGTANVVFGRAHYIAQWRRLYSCFVCGWRRYTLRKTAAASWHENTCRCDCARRFSESKKLKDLLLFGNVPVDNQTDRQGAHQPSQWRARVRWWDGPARKVVYCDAIWFVLKVRMIGFSTKSQNIVQTHIVYLMLF